MFLRHTTANENVSCEQRLRRLSSHDSRLSIFRGEPRSREDCDPASSPQAESAESFLIFVRAHQMKVMDSQHPDIGRCCGSDAAMFRGLHAHKWS